MAKICSLIAGVLVAIAALLVAMFMRIAKRDLSPKSNFIAIVSKLQSDSIGLHNVSPDDVEELQKRYDKVEKALKMGPKPEMARITDVHIDSKGGAKVPLRVYYPNATALANNETRPAVVMFHGGAFVYGSIDSYDSMARSVAAAADSVVVSVGYRQPPRHPYPAPLDDCIAAIKWTKQKIAAYNGNPNRVALLGDSAGGALAVVTALSLISYRLVAELEHRVIPVLPKSDRWWRKKPLCALVLASPLLSYNHGAAKSDSYTRYGTGDYFLSHETVMAAWRFYMASDALSSKDVAVGASRSTDSTKSSSSGGSSSSKQGAAKLAGSTTRASDTAAVDAVVAARTKAADWRVSPLLAPDWRLRTLPATLLLYATTEVFTDENRAFAERLKAASRSRLTVNEYTHTLHGFFARDMLTHGADSLAKAAAFIKAQCT